LLEALLKVERFGVVHGAANAALLEMGFESVTLLDSDHALMEHRDSSLDDLLEGDMLAQALVATELLISLYSLSSQVVPAGQVR